MKLTTLKFALGMALVFLATAAPAFAQTAPVPEIGIGNLASAVTLLSGGYLILKSRFGR